MPLNRSMNNPCLCSRKFLVTNCRHRECHSRKLLSREQQPLIFHGNVTSPPIIYTKEHRCQQLYRSSIVCFRSSNHFATASSMYTFIANSLVFIRAWFNGVLSGLRQFLAAESFKNNEKCCLLYLKSCSRSQDI